MLLADSLGLVQIELKEQVDVNRPFRGALFVCRPVKCTECGNHADGRTALEVASLALNWELIRALLNANADINVQFRGESAALLERRT